MSLPTEQVVLHSAPEWLTDIYLENVLRKYKKDETIKLVELDITPATAKGENYASLMTRVKITYKSERIEALAVESVIVKTTYEGDSFTANLMSQYNIYKTEMEMYEKILPKLTELLKEVGDQDKLFANTIHVDHEHSAIIFEDLSVLNFVVADRLAGMDMTHTKLALKKLAKMHATAAALNQRRPGSLHHFNLGIFNRHTQGFSPFFVNMFEVCSNFARDCEELGAYYADKLTALKPFVVEYATCVSDPCEQFFNTLTHGDFWINNIMLRYDDNEQSANASIKDILLIDFQFCAWASPAVDLHYFFNTSLKENVRFYHQEELVQYYYQILTATLKQLNYLSKIPTLHEFWLQLEAGRFYAGDDKYFKIVKDGRNQSSLYLQKSVPAGVYNINVRATDGGGSFSEEIRNLKLVFVDTLGNPMFLETKFNTNFTENQDGFGEERLIPAAYDPKNEGLDEGEDEYELYYFIDESYRPDDAKLFSLDKQNRTLKLKALLDRESNDTHQLRIAVSNSPNGAQINPNGIKNMLDITIIVNDVNDSPPVFVERFFAAGITPKDSVGKEILVFHALDPDLNDPTSYMIDNSSLKTQGVNIEYNKLELFSINETTGALTLSSYVQNNMKGYFMFDVVASDTADPAHTDKVQAKIYIVSESNRVKFVFLSDVQDIRHKEQFIREVFQEIYGYEICNIDAVEDVTNRQQRSGRDESIVGAFISELIVHFINDNEAVEAAEIQKRSSDLAFISKLQNSLQRQKLILNNVPHLGLDEVTQTFDDWLLIALIATSVLLAALCAILTVAFVLKTRALNRQLRAFEPAKFGSIASDINRMGAPTTNIYAVEGSNPVINNRQFKSSVEAKEDNTSFSFSSESNDDDDFNNLQDDPIFDMNTFKQCKDIPDDVDILKTSDYFNINNNTEPITEKIRY